MRHLTPRVKGAGLGTPPAHAHRADVMIARIIGNISIIGDIGNIAHAIFGRQADLF